jgi:hypothetical protein
VETLQNFGINIGALTLLSFLVYRDLTAAQKDESLTEALRVLLDGANTKEATRRLQESEQKTTTVQAQLDAAISKGLMLEVDKKRDDDVLRETKRNLELAAKSLEEERRRNLTAEAETKIKIAESVATAATTSLAAHITSQKAHDERVLQLQSSHVAICNQKDATTANYFAYMTAEQTSRVDHLKRVDENEGKKYDVKALRAEQVRIDSVRDQMKKDKDASDAIQHQRTLELLGYRSQSSSSGSTSNK